MPVRLILSAICCALLLNWTAAADEALMPLWPDTPPGKIAASQPESDTTGADGREVAGRRVVRLGHVAQPMLTVYSPPADQNTGAAVVVCPGGGYHILAYDLEGSEVCEWLNSIGVTGILLKYRVPRPDRDVPLGPLMDAQRAMSLVRANAERWGIDPERVGVLGFSAGGHLAARLATTGNDRAYEAVDQTDEIDCAPNFAVLVYPAYLYDKKEAKLAMNVSESTPPMFLTMAFDDRIGSENILHMGLALKAADVPCEVHLYPTGGHGYGLRRTHHEATTWPDRCGAWMKANGWLKR